MQYLAFIWFHKKMLLYYANITSYFLTITNLKLLKAFQVLTFASLQNKNIRK